MRLALLDEHDRQQTYRIRAGGEARGQTRASSTSDEVHLTSTNFAAVLHALAGGPMTVVEIAAETGVSHELIEEIVRILALTWDVAPAGDCYTARNREARDAASSGRRFGEGLYR
jgi:hypothetical protein